MKYREQPKHPPYPRDPNPTSFGLAMPQWNGYRLIGKFRKVRRQHWKAKLARHRARRRFTKADADALKRAWQIAYPEMFGGGDAARS